MVIKGSIVVKLGRSLIHDGLVTLNGLGLSKVGLMIQNEEERRGIKGM